MYVIIAFVIAIITGTVTFKAYEKSLACTNSSVNDVTLGLFLSTIIGLSLGMIWPVSLILATLVVILRFFASAMVNRRSKEKDPSNEA